MLLRLQPAQPTATADQHHTDLRIVAQQLCRLHESFQRLGSPQVAGKNYTEMRFQQPNQLPRQPHRHRRRMRIDGVGVVDDLLALGKTRHRFDKRTRLHQQGIAVVIDGLDHPANHPKQLRILYKTGGGETLGPQVLHPQQQARLFQPLEQDGRDGLSDRRWREYQHRVELTFAQHPRQTEQACYYKRQIVEQQVLRAAVPTRPPRHPKHLDLVQIKLALAAPRAITVKHLTVRAIGLARSDHHLVALLSEYAHKLVDDEVLRPEVLADNQDSHTRLTSAHLPTAGMPRRKVLHTTAQPVGSAHPKCNGPTPVDAVFRRAEATARLHPATAQAPPLSHRPAPPRPDRRQHLVPHQNHIDR